MSTQEVDSVISLQQEKIAKKELAKKIFKAKCSEEHLEFEDLKVFGAIEGTVLQIIIHKSLVES
jgi:hypothetical protein